MTEDLRCCGTGTCLINAEGFCWCGQRWDGEKMCFPERSNPADGSGLGASSSAAMPRKDGQPERDSAGT